MASNTVTSLKTSNSTTSTTSGAPENPNSIVSGPKANQQGPPPGDDNDSGDEWGMDLGNLIIDLEADLQKDEMKKNDARNSNNNNSIKGSESNSPGGTSSQPTAISSESVLNPTNKIETGNPSKSTKSTVTSGGNLTQPPAKTKSKSKKGNKSNMNKHGVTLNNESSSGVDAPNSSTVGTKTVKPETASSKPSRNYKKHGKTNNSADKKNEAAGNVKDGREKTNKSGKGNKIPNQSITGAVSSTSVNYSMTGPVLSAPSTTLTQTVNKGKRVNSPSFFKTVSNHNSATTNNILTDITSDIGASGDGTVHSSKTFAIGVNEAPIMTPSAHPGKHRKTSSLPSVISYPSPRSMPSSPSALGNPTIDSLMTHGNSGKRDRNSMHGQALTAGNKKIKLDKETKSFASGMTPNDGDSITKGNSANIGANLAGHLSNLKTDLKMTVGQQKLSVDSKGDKKSNSSRANSSSSSQHNGKTRNSGNTSGIASMPGGQAGANVPLNNIPTPSEEKRSTGTVTTFADIGVSTEPESLGPCEPGTSVHLSGIVWHETESGVLVVNVTWRNRSYVGTLLDATKHDWAPPRIPDADSDAEYRVKSGRPKRQRGANGNGGDGRKGRKSALANSAIDEYKCSPSSNKRRSAKMSESDACSGNDGEICTTPSKSAKRARLSRTAAAKQAAQKSASAAAVKESSGDATSGSGSSACSSPVFMECPYANCNKKYEDNNALKYHEAHAHQGDDLEGEDKTRQDDQDSTAADSPKDSNDTSPKSVDDIAVSDSSGSPNDTVNETQVSESCIISSKMETSPPAASVPFVVTQPQKPTEQYTGHAVSSQTTPMHDPSFPKNTQSEESKANISDFSMDTTSNSNTARREQSIRNDGAASPYTLTDSQSNESISLKAHLQCKPPRPYRTSQPSAASYTDSSNLPQQDQSAIMEHTTADDNESAQAVQTLLQLQENSQDQLPGLTPAYGQASQASSMALTNPVVPTSTPSAPSQSIPASPGETLDKTSAESHLKAQSVPHGIPSQFRGHSKDGAPLPRMSVGVASSPRYAVGSYPHGTVAASSSQERHSHYTPTGLKMVKGKTVPIPTDPQQTLSGSSVASAQNTVSGSSGNAKKQKRKKPKSEPGKSPTDPGPKPISGHQVGGRLSGNDDKPGSISDHVTRIKQESPHNVIQHSGAAHHRTQHETNLHPSGGSLQIIPGGVKSEPDTKSLQGNTPPASRGAGYAHSGIPRGQRPHLRHPNPEVPVRDQAPLSSTNKNNNNKMAPHGRVSDPGGPSAQVSHPPQATNPGFIDSQERAHRLNILTGPGSSHSLPGSRSITPVNTASHTGSRQGQAQPRLSPGPHNTQRRPSKESASPQPTDSRKLSNEGKNPSRANFQPRSMYEYTGQFPLIPYEIGAYPTQFMNDPSLLQHYGNIIQHEIQKDQKAKEEQSDQHSSRTRSTPSPTPHLKHARPKSPTRNEELRSRESPPKVQHYHQQGGQLQAGHRVSHGLPRTARESPVPHGSFLATPNKTGSTGRGISPHPQAAPSPMSGARPPRPSSETERHHRREPSLGERTQPSSRTPTVTPSRKLPSKEGYPEQPSRSPDKAKPGPPPTSVYASPGVPAVQLPGGRIPVQFYHGSYQPPLIDPRSMPPYFAAGSPYVFPPAPASHFFHGAWPHGTPPPAMTGAVEKTQSHSPHPAKPSRDRSSSGSRSPYREDADRRSRDVARGREGESYSSSKERRASDGPPQSRKSVTPDPKAAATRNPQSEGTSGTASPPPMQRHVHTHHHIHEGFPTLIPPHPQYQYQMASAVMAGSEAALAQIPRRDLP